ncbi:hypothetical protein K449DRAFT_464299 [Hypoxylon sp. EC38]|nr:hypothetical protein K449DRAFT_464299 [Hypoxylon sp. EC38]
MKPQPLEEIGIVAEYDQHYYTCYQAHTTRNLSEILDGKAGLGPELHDIIVWTIFEPAQVYIYLLGTCIYFLEELIVAKKEFERGYSCMPFCVPRRSFGMNTVDTRFEKSLEYRPELTSHTNAPKGVNALLVDLEGTKASFHGTDFVYYEISLPPFNIRVRHRHCCLGLPLRK